MNVIARPAKGSSSTRLGTLAQLIGLVWLASTTSVSAQSPAYVEFSAAGKVQQGLRLVEFAQEIVVMGRDGWLHTLDAQQPVRPIDGTYEPLPAIQLRSDLRAEFGKNFEVIATQHFLVVQPVGRGNHWPNMFEQSHRAFLAFMRRRGVEVREGRFPMVAVVMPDETSMYAEFRRMKIDITRVSGVYANSSNRVITHDSGNREHIAFTVRHEAAHQSGFNSGVHSRVNDTPKWITEGVGQLFEPPVMAGNRPSSQLSEMVNHDSLRILRATYDFNKIDVLSPTIERLVTQDAMFSNHAEIEQAYAVSWAMMFYLAHRQPAAFAGILNRTTARPPFIEYARSEKLRDFEAIVGCSIHEFGKRVTRFIQSL